MGPNPQSLYIYTYIYIWQCPINSLSLSIRKNIFTRRLRKLGVFGGAGAWGDRFDNVFSNFGLLWAWGGCSGGVISIEGSKEIWFSSYFYPIKGSFGFSLVLP